MRQRGVHAEPRCTARAEKHAGTQPAELNAAREIGAAKIESAPRVFERRYCDKSRSATEDPAGPLPEIGNDHNLGLIISRARFDPCLPLAHIVRRSQVSVPVTAPDLQSTELVDQKEVNHTGNRIGAIHSRSAILQNVDVINHRETESG